MERIKSNLRLQRFYESTTIHGIYYLSNNNNNKKQRTLWAIIILACVILILTSTTLLLKKYFQYENYMIENEYDTDSLEALPNILICPSRQLSIVQSIISIRPTFYETVSKTLNQLNSFNYNGDQEKLYNYLSKFRQDRSESEKFDSAVVEELKKSFRNKNTSFSCKILANTIEYDCSHVFDVIFTFVGPCWISNFQEYQNSTILRKKVYPFSNIFDNRIQISLKVSSDAKYVNYDLISNEDAKLQNPYFFSKNVKLIENFCRYYFEVARVQESYTKAIHNVKCSTNYEEINCHYKCLQSMITKLLDCYFTFEYENYKMTTRSNLSYCSIDDMIIIEELIIKNYINNSCGSCLPYCELKYYSIKQIFSSDLEHVNKNLELNFHLNFIKIKREFILKMEFAQCLNLINGLWSLFLGVSVLSFCEIIEIFYSSICTKLKKVQLSRYQFRQFEKYFEMFTNRTGFLFKDTVLHGFKHIYNKLNSKWIKLRWLLIITGAFCALVYCTSDAVSNYMNYKTEIKKSIRSINDDVSDRNITLFVCSRLTFQKKFDKIYQNFSKISEDLFLTNRSFDQVLDAYRSLMKTWLYPNMSISDLYKMVFIDPSIEMYDLYDHSRLNIKTKANLYFNKYCTFFQSIFQLRNFKPMKTYIGTNCENGCSYFDNMGELTISIMDSQYTDVFDNSWFKCIPFLPYLILATLKHSKYLGAPFEPSCINQLNYSQQTCFRNCFNSIIYEKFGCKVVFGGIKSSNDDNHYCHPLMIPLIEVYEKQMMPDQCKFCKIPCEYFHYNVESKQPKVSNYDLEITFNNILLASDHIPINSLNNTVFIIISYFSLFFGGSLFALLQIFQNIIFIIIEKVKISKYMNLKIKIKMPLLDVAASSTTLHCLNYISSKNGIIVRALWILLVIAVFLLSCFYSVSEIKAYSSSKLEHLKKEIEATVYVPKIDICQNVQMSGLTEFNEILEINANELGIDKESMKNFNFLPYQTLLDTRKNVTDCFSSVPKTCSMKDYLEKLKQTYYGIIGKYGFLEKAMNIKVIERMKLLHNKHRVAFIEETAETSPIINQSDSIKIYFYGHLYITGDERDLKVLMCKTLDFHWKNFSINPFDHYKNRVALSVTYLGTGKDKDEDDEDEDEDDEDDEDEDEDEDDEDDEDEDDEEEEDDFYGIRERMRLYKDAEVFYEYYPSNALLYGNNFIQINHFTKFKFEDHCLNKTKCINSGISLHKYSEFILFYCDEEFQSVFYQVFNCTPFYTMNEGSQLNECPYFVLPLLNDIFKKFKFLDKCERIKHAHPVEFTITSNEIEKKQQITAFDFSTMRFFEQEFVQSYLSFELLTNLSNIYSLLIGFSVLTLFEMFFLFLVYLQPSKVTSTITLTDGK